MASVGNEPNQARDISRSVAVSSLNELVKQGVLTELQAASYQDKFQRLHEAVVSVFSNEKFLIGKARELKTLYAEEKNKLDTQVSSAEKLQGEQEQLMKECKAASAKVSSLSQERSELAATLEELLAHKKDREADLKERHERTMQEMEPIIAQLHSRIKDMGEEIEQLQDAYKKETRAQADYGQKIERCAAELSMLEKAKANQRPNVNKACEEPDRIRSGIAAIEASKQKLEQVRVCVCGSCIVCG